MIFTAAGLLEIVFSFTTSIAANFVSPKLMAKFQKDSIQLITDLVWDEYKHFGREFPEAADILKKDDLEPAIKDHFSDLTADKISDPLSLEAIQYLFMNHFLKSEYREAETFDALDPKYKNGLDERALHFKKDFEPRFKGLLERNSAAATSIFLNSLAQSGRNDTQMIGLLQEMNATAIDLPTQFSDIIEMQLVPVIRKQIQTEMDRFRHWEFTVEYLRGQRTETEAAEKEWLEVLAQVLEWKKFREIKRNPIPGVPGELFQMIKEDELEDCVNLVCWACPTEACPEHDLVRLASTHMSQRKNARLFVISKNPLSADLIKLLDELKIHRYWTLDEFLQTTLKITDHRESVVGDYEKQAIYQNFIDLNCHFRNNKKPLDLRAQFQTWLKSDDANHVSLLGNFGTGKTVFCRRMQYELLKEYQTGDRIPVLITLREQKGVKLEGMISKIMNDMGLKQLDYTAFRTLNRLGKFVVLIDGFDEMATYATLGEMRDNFLQLAVLAEGRAKVMLTCRTHYFEQADKEDEILSLPKFIADRPEFHVLYLNPFNREQIEAYLDRVRELFRDKQQVLEAMDGMPKLRELMEIPVLLDMILGIFGKLIHYGEALTLANVYDEAVSNWAHSEKEKGNLKNLSVEEVLTFMKDLAMQMHQTDELDVHFKKLRSRTKDIFHERLKIDYRDLDAFYGEIRTCTFLTRDSLGNYKFAHKSFMEYFAAAHLAPLLKKNKAPKIGINEEIRGFMHQILSKQIDYRTPEFQFPGKDLPTGMRQKEGDPFTFIHEKDDSEMVWIPDGQFIAGEDESLKITRLEKGAFLDKFLVTNQQYARFLTQASRFDDKWIDLHGSYKNENSRIKKAKNGFTVEPGYEMHPVNFVSYYGIEAYADWAGKDIPSEWLWEKAGRGLNGRNYPWGDTWDPKRCNSADYWEKHDSGQKITPVDFFVNFNSPFDCADLSGNLWEWTREVWKEDQESRVVRGGCFFDNRIITRLAFRIYDLMTFQSSSQGFRLSRTC